MSTYLEKQLTKESDIYSLDDSKSILVPTIALSLTAGAISSK